jgi:hypothetical protein
MGCVPLAIVLIAQASTGQSCHFMLQRWRKQHTALLQTQTPQPDRLSSVDVSISLSLKSVPMKQCPEAVNFLSMISHLPDGLLNWEDNLKDITHAFQHAEDAVGVLLKVALVYVDTMGGLKVLSPIRYYMLHQQPASKMHIQQLESHYIAMVDKYAQNQFDEHLLVPKQNSYLKMETSQPFSCML